MRHMPRHDLRLAEDEPGMITTNRLAGKSSAVRTIRLGLLFDFKLPSLTRVCVYVHTRSVQSVSSKYVSLSERVMAYSFSEELRWMNAGCREECGRRRTTDFAVDSFCSDASSTATSRRTLYEGYT